MFDYIIIAYFQILAKSLFADCPNIPLNTAQKLTASLNKLPLNKVTDHGFQTALTNKMFCRDNEGRQTDRR
jgi:hypothetical protein